jgi:hypothetical protein
MLQLGFVWGDRTDRIIKFLMSAESMNSECHTNPSTTPPNHNSDDDEESNRTPLGIWRGDGWYSSELFFFCLVRTPQIIFLDHQNNTS